MAPGILKCLRDCFKISLYHLRIGHYLLVVPLVAVPDSTSKVFRGMCLGQAVAVKTMLDVTEENVQAFRDEILLTAMLRHPVSVNVPVVFCQLYLNDLSQFSILSFDVWLEHRKLCGSLLGRRPHLPRA